MLDERGDVVGVTVRPQIDEDDLSRRRESCDVVAEHHPRAECAVAEHGRLAGAVGLVIEKDAVHVGVAAGGELRGRAHGRVFSRVRGHVERDRARIDRPAKETFEIR